MRLERLSEAENHERLDCYVKEFSMFPKSNRKLIKVVNRCILTRSVFAGEEITHIVFGRVDQRWARINVLVFYC